MRGLNFQAGERVRVILSAQDVLVRRAKASAAGSFVVSFGQVSIGRCEAFGVRAVGDRDSRAVLKLPQPACLP